MNRRAATTLSAVRTLCCSDDHSGLELQTACVVSSVCVCVYRVHLCLHLGGVACPLSSVQLMLRCRRRVAAGIRLLAHSDSQFDLRLIRAAGRRRRGPVLFLHVGLFKECLNVRRSFVRTRTPLTFTVAVALPSCRGQAGTRGHQVDLMISSGH